jgi:uncharacterized membrane protein
MTSSARPPEPPRRASWGPGSILLAAAGVAYPFVVYAAWDRVPAPAFIAAALMLVLLRAATLRHLAPRPLLAVGGVAASGLGLLALVDPGLATRAYPVLVSLVFATAFGASLVYPPTLIERFARLREPALTPAAVVYTRKVTIAWTAFLLANAAVSGITAMAGDLALWTLYNGLVSYLLMGLLFGGELLVRRRVRARHGQRP